MIDLVSSGYLERLGFDYKPSPHRAFREPSRLAQAFLPAT